jgi:putative Mg2+ transporter-C (MgtC) family protein
VNWGDALSPHFWLQILLVVACSATIGLERQLSGKPAGVRTSVLVCVGTFVFVYLSQELPGSDPTRVLGQVVTGIGFLGAGLILSKGGLVKGVTSAAVIWVLAAIGAAVGLNRAGIAAVLAGVTVLTLTGVPLLEKGLLKLKSMLSNDERPRESDPAPSVARRDSAAARAVE